MNGADQMNKKIIEKSKIPALIKDLLKEYEVFAPVKEKTFVSFERITYENEICLDFQNVKASPKGIFFPQTEILFHYRVGKSGIEVTESHKAAKKTILFGVRPCDARGFVLVDKFLSSGEVKDNYYSEKRDNSLIISLACNDPSSTCFCTSVGGNPFGRTGADLLLSDLGDEYFLEAVSEKGEKFIKNLSELREATKRDMDRSMRLYEEAEKSVKSVVSVKDLNVKLDKVFEDPVWDNIREKCVNCGVCTFLCPTCCCFDILDEGTSEGRRVRIWDSCQFPFFTAQGSGHNPRPSGKEMMRQRMMHKFNYYPNSFGENFCVGCGRCVRECPVNLDIREIIETIQSLERK